MQQPRSTLAVLGAALVSIALLLGYQVWADYQDAMALVKSKTHDYALTLATRLDVTLRHADASLKSVEGSLAPAAQAGEAPAPNDQSLIRALEAIRTGFPEIATAGVLDVSGNLRQSTTLRRGLNLADRRWFQQLRDTPVTDTVYGEVVSSRITGELTFAVARAVRDPLGGFRGVVYLSIDLPYFQRLFSELDLGPNGEAAIYRTDTFEEVVGWPHVQRGPHPALPPDNPLRRAVAGGDTSGTLDLVLEAGDPPSVFGYRVLASSPFMVVVGVAHDDALAAWRKSALLVALAAVVVLGLMAGLTLRLRRALREQGTALALLEKNEQRLRLLVKAASLGLWEWDVRTNSVYLSPQWKEQLGYQDHEVPNAPGAWGRWLHPDDEAPTRRQLQRFVDREIDDYRLEVRLRHRDGSWRWIESRAHRVEDSSGNVVLVIGSHLDITDRKETELRLTRSEVLSGRAESLANIGSWDWDMKAGDSIWSEQLFRIYGRDPAAGVPGFYAWEETVHPDDREALRQCHQTALAQGGSYELEFRIHTLDHGTLKYLHSRGEVVMDPDGLPRRFWGVDQDITERKLKEAAQADAERRFQGIVRSAMDGIITIDEAQRIVVFNEAAGRMFRMAPEDAIGQPLERFVPERLRERHRAHIAEFARSGGAGRSMGGQFPIAGLRSDGHEFPMEASISGVKVGQTMQLTVILRDISRRAALESQLRESQKMEAIGTLAGGIAHDFNNIVAAILGNALLARQDASDAVPAEVRTSLTEIQRAALRAKSLVNQILSFSRKQTTAIKSIELQPVIRESTGLLRATIPAGVRLDLHLPEKPVRVRADETQIEQVILNLCTNAWHAGAHAIQVTLEVGPRPPWHGEDRDQDAENIDGEQGYAILSVADDGWGMDENIRKRIFEPFFTTKAVGKGTGLGLAVVHGIVRHHGGSINVQSEVGVGSRFAICLPLAKATASQAASTPSAPPQPGNARGLRVLYVDDDDAMRLLFERLMTREGFEVTTCGEALTALEVLAGDPEGIDVMVTDYNMPGASGTELAKVALKTRADLPILLTSGNVTEGLLATAREIGIRRVVAKPDTVESLAQVIMDLVRAAPLAPP